jgi:hypothetical protein
MVCLAPEPPSWRVFLSTMVDAKDYTPSEIKLRLEQIGFERCSAVATVIDEN